MYYVRDLERAATFYEDVLGLARAWTDSAYGMVGLAFRERDAEIVLHSDSRLRNPDFSFLVSDVAAFCADYRARGYRVVRGPFEVRCGKFAVLADLDGNEIPIVDLTKFGNVPRFDAR